MHTLTELQTILAKVEALPVAHMHVRVLDKLSAISLLTEMVQMRKQIDQWALVLKVAQPILATLRTKVGAKATDSDQVLIAGALLATEKLMDPDYLMELWNRCQPNPDANASPDASTTPNPPGC